MVWQIWWKRDLNTDWEILMRPFECRLKAQKRIQYGLNLRSENNYPDRQYEIREDLR
jgi:hypothetical protein